MNQNTDSKFAPTLPDDDDNNTSNDNSIKVYDGVAECIMNDSDNLKSIKLRAKDLAQKNVQEKIAEHIYFFLKDRCLPLPEDETLSVANEIANITDVKYNVLDSDDDKILIRATVTAQIDDNDIMNYVIKCFKERTELKIQNEALRKENEDLKRLIISKDKIELANQKYEAAFNIYWKEDYRGAIKLYDEVIHLNPYMYQAYNIRGKCYKALGEKSKAESDFSKADKLRNQGW